MLTRYDLFHLSNGFVAEQLESTFGIQSCRNPLYRYVLAPIRSKIKGKFQIPHYDGRTTDNPEDIHIENTEINGFLLGFAFDATCLGFAVTHLCGYNNRFAGFSAGFIGTKLASQLITRVGKWIYTEIIRKRKNKNLNNKSLESLTD